MARKVKEADGGIYITNCDGFCMTDFGALSLKAEGINIFSAAMNMDRIAGKLGAVHDIKGEVDIFVEKKSRAETAEAFADDQRYVSTGLIPANTANAICYSYRRQVRRC